MRDWPRIRLVTILAAVGGAIAFAIGLTPPTILHAMALYRSPTVPADALFYALPSGLLGLLAGAGLAFGITALGGISGRRVRQGRILGGALFGGLSFAVALAPLTVADTTGSTAITAILIGSAAFGVLIGLGITAGEAAFGKRAAWAGGALGAALGSMVLYLAGFPVYQDVPPSVSIACAALLGLILAYSISSAEQKAGYQLPPVRSSHNLNSVQETA